MLKKLLLSILSAVLLFISWPPITTFNFLIFIALVPLLLLDSNFKKDDRSFRAFFFFPYLTFLIFNLFTTYWINYAHFGGAVFAILCNSFFMALVCYFYFRIKHSIPWKNSLFLFPILWIGFEYLHLNWDLSWPWLTLGNVFSSSPNWVQWYSYTGVLGGTLWILIVNLLITQFLNRKNRRLLFFIILFLSIPLLLSKHLYDSQINLLMSNNEKINVLVVQPNIDPYQEKFSITQKEQTDRLIQFIKPYIHHQINYILLPETFLTEPIWENSIMNNLDIKKFKRLIADYTYRQQDSSYIYPVSIIVGATTLKFSKKESTAKPISAHHNKWYQVHNTALHLKATQNLYSGSHNESMPFTISKYYKSKLVPGAEKMPFQKFLFPIFGDRILKIGSSTSLGNFSTQDSISLFRSKIYDFDISSNAKETKHSIAPIICYESIYGDYVRQFVKKGAGAIFIITNDGWWKKTSGYQQHNMYAKLRAIETRRYIARSANTGISSIISPLGHIQQSVAWDKEDVIIASVGLGSHQTFYVKHGDFIGRFSAFLSVIILLCFFVMNKIRFSNR